jgi:hypothetical protein
VNVKFSLKLELFIFKVPTEATMSSHINNIRSIIRQLAKVKEVVAEEDANVVLMNSLPLEYSSAIFTLSQLPSQSLDQNDCNIASRKKKENQ